MLNARWVASFRIGWQSGQHLMLQRAILGVLFLLAIAVGAVPSARPQISCGDTLGPGGKFAATADIGPCADDPALTIVGSVKVDFAGHELACDSATKVGIEILGKGAKVENGAITGCDDAITVGGEGKHKLTRMVVRGIEGHGFFLTSDGNKLKECAVADAQNDAIRLVDASKNAVTDSHVARIDGTGIQVDASHGNKFKRVSAAAVDRGFVVMGDRNKFDDCQVMAASVLGVDLLGSRNRFKEFSVVDTATGFVFASGSANTLTRCRIVAAIVHGIIVKSGVAGTAINKCHVIRSLLDGIVLEDGATGSVVKKNVVLHSRGTDAVDGNVDCGSNTWASNTIGDSQPPAGGCVE